MKIVCNECDLGHLIEKNRLKLNKLISEKNLNLIDNEVVLLSQTLDKLLVDCVSCKKSIELMEELDFSNVFGIHSTFYYYGNMHLFINMLKYIKQGVDNKELVYISMEHDLYNKLIEILQSTGIYGENVRFLSVKKFILSHKSGGLDNLRRVINAYTEDAIKEGYNGIRLIGQPTFAMQETSKEDFLNWELDLSSGFKDLNASIICIYDAYDYMHDENHIDEDVMNESLTTHTHILNKFISDFIND